MQQFLSFNSIEKIFRQFKVIRASVFVILLCHKESYNFSCLVAKPNIRKEIHKNSLILSKTIGVFQRIRIPSLILHTARCSVVSTRRQKRFDLIKIK